MRGIRRAMVWKLLGVAGLAGVAATGVVVVRDHRRRQQLRPEEVRERLLARYAALDGSGASASGDDADHP